MEKSKTGIRQRAWLAWDVLKNGLPWERATKQNKQAKFPLAWPMWRTGEAQWSIIDFQNYIDEGFNMNTLIYEAVMYKVRAVQAVKLRAYKGDPDHPDRLDQDHPLAQLVTRPNPYMSRLAMQGLNTAYLNIAGNCYNVLVRPRGGGVPEAMYTMRPDRVTIVPNPKGKGIIGYYYVPEGVSIRDGTPILAQDMIHVKLPNPGDPLDGLGYGLSPFGPLARSADVDNSITKFIKKFFDGGAMTTGILKYDVPLDESALSQIKENWEEIYGGWENWATAVLDQGGSYERTGMTFDEMGFSDLDERNEARILGPLGVSPILVASRIGLKSTIRENYENALRAFWRDVMYPECQLFEDGYSYYLQSDDGGFVANDYSGVAAMQDDVPKLVDAWATLVGLGVPKDTATKVTGLDLEDLPDGKVIYMPLNLQPMPQGAKPVAPTTPAGETAPTVPAKPTTTPTNVGAPEAEEQAEEEQGGKAAKSSDSGNEGKA